MERLGIVVTVRAELEIIEAFIQYHLSKKIDEIFIFLDDPIFNEIPNTYHNNSIVKFILCDEKYWSSNHIKLNGTSISSRPETIEDRQLANYLYANTITTSDWLANIDIDELIYSPYSLQEILGVLPDNIFSIRMSPVEAVYEKGINGGVFDTCYFKVINTKNNKLSQKIYSSSLESNNGFWGHRMGKILARTNEVVEYISNHRLIPLNKSLLIDVSFNFLNILHFEGMNERLFIEKQRRRFNRDVVVQKLSNREFRRLDHFKQCYEKNGDLGLKLLYEHMHVFDAERLNFGISSGFIEYIDYRVPPKTYDIGLQDFHFNNLYYLPKEEKIFSSPTNLGLGVYVIFFTIEKQKKAIFFIKNKHQEFDPLITDGSKFYVTRSRIFSGIDVLKKDGFYIFTCDELYLISFNTGKVHLKSTNLGDWELFEKIKIN